MVDVFWIFLFVLGTIIGSFLNVAVFRLGTGERIGNARSRCFSCGKMLAWHDMIPLMSFLFQKGKCRYCGSRISRQYPIVEFVTGLMFLLVALKLLNYQYAEVRLPHIGFDFFGTFAYWGAIFSILIAISVYDFRHKIIPNQFVYPLIMLALMSGIFGSPTSAIFSEVGLPKIIAGVGAWAFFASLWFVSKGRWMGFGDAKLALGIGFFLGPLPTFLAVVLSFWIGTLIAVPATLLRGGGLKTQIPFGPFLALGTLAAWLFGETILSFFRALFL